MVSERMPSLFHRPETNQGPKLKTNILICEHNLKSEISDPPSSISVNALRISIRKYPNKSISKSQNFSRIFFASFFFRQILDRNSFHDASVRPYKAKGGRSACCTLNCKLKGVKANFCTNVRRLCSILKDGQFSCYAAGQYLSNLNS